MQRYIALLRAINVGGRNVKMAGLRALFEALGYQHVETFIASGNVIFEAAARERKQLEKEMESALRAGLGFEVDTFVRTTAEIVHAATFQPFPRSEIEAAASFNVGFVAEPLDDDQTSIIMSMETEIDRFRVHGREVYWLCRTRQSDSSFSNAIFERKLKTRSTWRGLNTVQRLAAKYGELPS